MGYDINLVDSEFFISIDDIPDARRALEGYSNGYDTVGPARPSDYIDKPMKMLDWPIEFDEDGNIVDINFEGINYHDDLKLFVRLAPFVKPGSFLEISGNGGEDHFRWAFDGQSVKEVKAKF